MQLVSTRIQRFRNFTDAQDFQIEPDVTCLVGKNESGKTTILKALHRLNPANGSDHDFDVTIEYPRWDLAADRRRLSLGDVAPISATFEMDESDRIALGESGLKLPDNARVLVRASRTYDQELEIELVADSDDVLREAATAAGVDPSDIDELSRHQTAGGSAANHARQMSRQLKEDGMTARSTALAAFPNTYSKLQKALESEFEDPVYDVLKERIPKFFYFSDYDSLPGECNLHQLARKIEANERLTRKEQTVRSLLSYANETPDEFLDEGYDSRKAELQAAGTELTRKVFKYWRTNRDLAVTFDTDMPVLRTDQQGREVRERLLKIEMRDERHGGIETNFETRSAGFQWFFSFLAAFSRYQEPTESVIVLLDEPGTSLHGEAQRDFLNFINQELGASQQVLYTTHSQHMIDPTRYESLRAVHDRASRDHPDLGVAVTPVSLSADPDTVLPVEAALGYSISQHLFLGSGHHLVVEGSSDFIYLQRMSEALGACSRTTLDPRLAIIPVGSVDNAPPFVALLGRRLQVSVLIDGQRSSRQRERILAAARDNGVPESALVVCSDVSNTPANADIEDLFHVDDYVWLYSQSVGPLRAADLPETTEPILKKIDDEKGKFDHALPAHTLTERRDEFLEQVREDTLTRFEQLIQLLNATLV